MGCYLSLDEFICSYSLVLVTLASLALCVVNYRVSLVGFDCGSSGLVAVTVAWFGSFASAEVKQNQASWSSFDKLTWKLWMGLGVGSQVERGFSWERNGPLKA